MKYKKVYFKWADTTSPVNTGQAWWSIDEAIDWAENDNYWVEQTGFLIKKTKKFILLAGHINITESAGQKIESLGTLIKIPTTWIKDFKYLK